MSFTVEATLPDGYHITSPELPTFQAATIEYRRLLGVVGGATIIPRNVAIGPDDPTIMMTPLEFPTYRDRPDDANVMQLPSHLDQLPRHTNGVGTRVIKFILHVLIGR